MWVYMLTEPMPGTQLPAVVVSMVTYGEVHLGSWGVPICLHNLSTHSVEIPTKTVVGQVVPANQLPLVVLPTRISKESNSNPQKGWGLGGPGSPRPQGLAHTTGQRAAAQMGAPVCLQ